MCGLCDYVRGCTSYSSVKSLPDVDPLRWARWLPTKTDTVGQALFAHISKQTRAEAGTFVGQRGAERTAMLLVVSANERPI